MLFTSYWPIKPRPDTAVQAWDLDGVFHVHGCYHDPHEVVLDGMDYYAITQSDEVQNLLKTSLEFHTILFVGCGSGLEDPNFDALLKRASEHQENISNRHCLLIRNGDSLNYRPLVRLKYGLTTRGWLHIFKNY